jgi:hypothetical protein
MNARRNVLVVYHLREAVPRLTILDHLYSFKRYSSDRVFYYNVADGGAPSWMHRMSWDVVIFHYAFVSDRIVPEHWAGLVQRVDFLRSCDCIKIAIPQDEYMHCGALNRFIVDFGVSRVFTCAYESDWPKIYPEAMAAGVQFKTVITGYLEPRTLQGIERLARRGVSRDIDVGYRSWYPWPSLGRHARLKGAIGELFAREAPARGFVVDISNPTGEGNDNKDTLKGWDWFRFLLRCRFTIGVEGGASILDFDGSIHDRTQEFLSEHPGADFETVEAACFPGAEGSVGLLAISPRHLEACATRTCQVLVEGRYNDALVPGIHYIELKRDFSNLDAVLSLMKDEQHRLAMVERAHRDVVRSGDWSYAQFVRTVMEGLPAPRRAPSLVDSMLLAFNRVQERTMLLARRLKGLVRSTAVGLVGESAVVSLNARMKRALRR